MDLWDDRWIYEMIDVWANKWDKLTNGDDLIKWFDGQMDGWMDGWDEGWLDWWINWCISHEWLDGWMLMPTDGNNECEDWRMNIQVVVAIHEWIDNWMNWRKEGWVYKSNKYLMEIGWMNSDRIQGRPSRLRQWCIFPSVSDFPTVSDKFSDSVENFPKFTFSRNIFRFSFAKFLMTFFSHQPQI